MSAGWEVAAERKPINGCDGPPLPLSSEEFSFAATEEDMEKSILNAEKENYT